MPIHNADEMRKALRMVHEMTPSGGEEQAKAYGDVMEAAALGTFHATVCEFLRGLDDPEELDSAMQSYVFALLKAGKIEHAWEVAEEFADGDYIRGELWIIVYSFSKRPAHADRIRQLLTEGDLDDHQKADFWADLSGRTGDYRDLMRARQCAERIPAGAYEAAKAWYSIAHETHEGRDLEKLFAALNVLATDTPEPIAAYLRDRTLSLLAGCRHREDARQALQAIADPTFRQAAWVALTQLPARRKGMAN